MDSINELVTELPLEEESAAIEDLFASVANPCFVKKEERLKVKRMLLRKRSKKHLGI